MTDPRTGEQIASELGEVYWFWKDAEHEKEKLRKEFFQAVTDSFDVEDLAEKTVSLPEHVAEDELAEYAEQYHPGWKLVKSTGIKLLLREDPALKAGVQTVLFRSVDEATEEEGITGVYDRKGVWHPGYVVTKSIVGGSALIDTERMQSYDPDLWDELSEWQSFPGVDQQSDPTLDDRLEALGWPRIIGKLGAAGVKAVRPYSYEGKRTVKLLVRYAKDEDVPGT